MMLPFNPFTGPEHESFTLQGGQNAVLLIHGFPGTPNEMRPLAELLHAGGLTVQALLLPGFGPDLHTLADRRHGEWLAAIQTTITALKKTHKRVIVSGFSMGGALALASAPQTQPDALILLAPFWRLSHPLWNVMPLMGRIFPTIKPFRLFKPDFSNPDMRRGMAEMMPGVDLDDPQVQQGMRDFAVPIGMFNEVRKVGQLAAQAAAQVHVPTLVAQGDKDPIVTPTQTGQLLRNFAEPLTYVELPAQHDLLDETKPAWPTLAVEIERFLLGLRQSDGAK